jgi:hypothetical protein
MGTNNNTSRMVAQALPQLRERCGFCIALSRGVDANIDEGFVGFGDCVVCMGQGWMPTANLTTILTEIVHPFTLAVSKDMLGWTAKLTVDGESLWKYFTVAPMFDTPLDAVYASLHRFLEDRKPPVKVRS